MIFTIGHSTRSFEEFAVLLRAHGVEQLADIRTVPRSRRHPHFSKEVLSASLSGEGIVYRHFPALGGLRKPRRDSPNTAWRHEGFRGYADYMETPAFRAALDALIAFAGSTQGRSVVTKLRLKPTGNEKPSEASLLAAASPRGGGAPRTVIMCAEAMWWRCHRHLVADALVARGIAVRHITSPASAPAHTLTEFARVEGESVTYRGLL